jgi:PHD/YefM family antitoxin component YafN of YafNO toxin-antitoxin module
MTHLSTSEFRRDAAKALNRVAFSGERIVLRRHDEDLVAIIPMEDYNLLCRLEDEADLAEARKSLASLKKGKAVPLAVIKARLKSGARK